MFIKHRTIRTAALVVGAGALLTTGGGVALATTMHSTAHALYTTDPLYLTGARTAALTVYSDGGVTAQMHEIGGGTPDKTVQVDAARIDLDGTRYLAVETASIALGDTGRSLRGYDVVLPAAILQPSAERHGCVWTYGQDWLEPEAPHLAKGGAIISGYCLDQGRANAVVHARESGSSDS